MAQGDPSKQILDVRTRLQCDETGLDVLVPPVVPARVESHQSTPTPDREADDREDDQPLGSIDLVAVLEERFQLDVGEVATVSTNSS